MKNTFSKIPTKARLSLNKFEWDIIKKEIIASKWGNYLGEKSGGARKTRMTYIKTNNYLEWGGNRNYNGYKNIS